jgi:sulfate adenylyltransferase subunit 2
MRVFPPSNWTELDIWRHIARENVALPDLYFAHP